jgi:hypothetical protein
MVKAETGELTAGHLQPPTKQPSLQGGVGLMELRQRDIQNSGSLPASMTIQPPLHKGFPETFLLLEDGGGSNQGSIQITIKMISEERKDFEAHAVSPTPGLQIGAVFAPAQAVAAEIVQDFGAMTGEERSDDTGTTPCRHAPQAPGPRTAKQPEEEFLGLVVGIVTQSDAGGLLLGHEPAEAQVAKGACRHLERASMLSLPGTEIEKFHHHREIKASRHGRDKAGVFVRLLSSEAVVDVSHHELQGELPPQPMEEMTESDGVRPARNRQDHPLASGLDHPVSRDGLTNFFEEHQNIPAQELYNHDDFVKSRRDRRHSKKLQMQGARILRNEEYIDVRRNDER